MRKRGAAIVSRSSSFTESAPTNPSGGRSSTISAKPAARSRSTIRATATAIRRPRARRATIMPSAILSGDARARHRARACLRPVARRSRRHRAPPCRSETLRVADPRRTHSRCIPTAERSTNAALPAAMICAGMAEARIDMLLAPARRSGGAQRGRRDDGAHRSRRLLHRPRSSMARRPARAVPPRYAFRRSSCAEPRTRLRRRLAKKLAAPSRAQLPCCRGADELIRFLNGDQAARAGESAPLRTPYES